MELWRNTETSIGHDFLEMIHFPDSYTELYYDVPQFSPYEALWQYATLWILHKMAEENQTLLEDVVTSESSIVDSINWYSIPMYSSCYIFTYFLDSMINIP